MSRMALRMSDDAVPRIDADDRRRPPTHNLPAALSSFVGRETEVATLREAIGRTRLLSLVGAGGAGKTRLAREVAVAFLDGDGAEAAWWVELAPLREAADVAPALAAVLGVNTAPGRDLLDALLVALAGQRTLLVFDNCEHVVDEVARVTERLLRGDPTVRVLCTSREPLVIDGEVAWAVPALAVPTRDMASLGRLSAHAVAPYDAVQLFVERTQAVTPRFALSDANATAIATICARLDGMPLALELAAAVVPVVGVDGLVDRLDDALTLLARGKRTAEPRHRTLRAVLDWSYELLSEPERTLLRRLSVFRGAFPLEAIEFVCCDETAPGSMPAATMAALGRLVEHSLVEVREAHGEATYRLLETVRQYGSTLLRDTPDEPRVRARHARWIAALAMAAEPALFSPARGATVERLRRYMDEIRAALTWALGPDGDVRVAVQLAGVLGWFWISGVPWDEARTLVHRVLAANDAQGILDAERSIDDRLWLGRLFYAIEGLAYFAGDTGTLLTATERDIALWETLREIPLEAAPRLAAQRQEALAWQLRGLAFALRGVVPEAIPAMDRSIAVAEASGDPWLLPVMMIRRALVHYYLGRAPAALDDYAAAIPALRRIGERWFLSLALEGMANVLVAMGEVTRAIPYARDAALVLDDERDPWFVSRACDTTAWVVAAAPTTHAILGSAEAALLGATLMGAADALRRSCGAGIIGPDVQRNVSLRERLIARLGSDAFSSSWATGSTWTIDEVLRRMRSEALLDVALASESARDASVGPAGDASVSVESVTHAVVGIQVLGGFSLTRDGAAVPDTQLPTGKMRELLAYLLVHPVASKEDIGLALWPDASAAQVRNIFHVTLHHLRKALGEERWIVFEKNRYRLLRESPEHGRLEADVDAVLAASTETRHALRRRTEVAADDVARWRRAFERGQGDLLQGIVAEEWLVPVQDRVRAAWAEGMDALIQLARVAGQHDAMIPLCELLVAKEPFRESAHRSYMEALDALGEPARALAHYEALAVMLRREVGSKPSAETQALAARLRR